MSIVITTSYVTHYQNIHYHSVYLSILFYRILIYGGAKIVHITMPIKEEKSLPDVTYVVMDASKKLHAAQLLDYGFLCVGYEFVKDVILKVCTHQYCHVKNYICAYKCKHWF